MNLHYQIMKNQPFLGAGFSLVKVSRKIVHNQTDNLRTQKY